MNALVLLQKMKESRDAILKETAELENLILQFVEKTKFPLPKPWQQMGIGDKLRLVKNITLVVEGLKSK